MMMLNNPKVRHERGEGEDPFRLEELEASYEAKKEEVELEGINMGVFDATIPYAIKLKRKERIDNQCNELRKKEKVFSCSGM
mmetsp:Transcript_61831/g.72270  ORF Transcript_61831/g.72270 Transcript_61831/m.72270 type:complete len:82 (+) Transcript_61831:145-390(+)|eukprot:CAMPEP_0194399118 /NCGR_PEP_ID=MMETSP0174-20130528/126483_1 /TAXON_ID=216777 /ORGANISM="Proboscia alata, Strain PI-D3" /LENGTH=81 /DNA_ID=CAMNT_0039195493 /DNA_START=796 /DNA_END=1041 /DNA_ORIENTATION=-